MFICENGRLKMDINRVLCMIINSRRGPTVVHHAPWGSHSHGGGEGRLLWHWLVAWHPQAGRQPSHPRTEVSVQDVRNPCLVHLPFNRSVAHPLKQRGQVLIITGIS